MKNVIMCVLVTTLLGACATQQETGQVTGAVLGGAVGSLFGQGTGKVVGAGVGAVIGGLIGGEIGKNMDRNDDMNVRTALDTQPVGMPYTWKGDGFTYSVTIWRRYTMNGLPCVDYSAAKWAYGNLIERKDYRACKQPNMMWSAYPY